MTDELAQCGHSQTPESIWICMSSAGLRGLWDRALAEYREAVRLSPADYAAQYNLALAIKKQGDDHNAIPEFQKAIALAPGAHWQGMQLIISKKTT